MFPLEVVLAVFGIASAITFLYFIVLRQLEPDFQNPDKGDIIQQSARARARKEPAERGVSTQLQEKPTETPPISPPVPQKGAPNQERICLHYVGYLAERPKGGPIPDECFGCQQVVKCMKLQASRAIESFYIDQTTA